MCLGLRLISVSISYCMCGQDLRRKARRCNDTIHGLGLRLNFFMCFYCIHLGSRVIGKQDLLLHLFRVAFEFCQYFPLYV